MTSNQIAYQNMLETQRSNQVREQETERHNKVQEYNQLIDVLDNVFSLGAHAAEGSNNITEGLSNQVRNLTPNLRQLAETLWDTLSNDAQKEKAREYYDIFNNLKNRGAKVVDSFGKGINKIVDVTKRANNKLKDSFKNIFN